MKVQTSNNKKEWKTGLLINIRKKFLQEKNIKIAEERPSHL
jgi:hypothetical protein